MEPTFEQARLISVVYVSSLLPLILVLFMMARGRLPRWIPGIYAGSFLACALGWELWFTYGWIDGDPVNLRRAEALNIFIPLHLNWLLNSLADAGSICLGGLWLAWHAFGRKPRLFRTWSWSVFGFLLFIFLGQNIFVEMFLYHDQFAEGKTLSWAPLAPSGPYFNPTLFRFNDRTITLQGQIPWLLMTPLFYGTVVLWTRRYDRKSSISGT